MISNTNSIGSNKNTEREIKQLQLDLQQLTSWKNDFIVNAAVSHLNASAANISGLVSHILTADEAIILKANIDELKVASTNYELVDMGFRNYNDSFIPILLLSKVTVQQYVPTVGVSGTLTTTDINPVIPIGTPLEVSGILVGQEQFSGIEQNAGLGYVEIVAYINNQRALLAQINFNEAALTVLYEKVVDDAPVASFSVHNWNNEFYVLLMKMGGIGTVSLVGRAVNATLIKNDIVWQPSTINMTASLLTQKKALFTASMLELEQVIFQNIITNNITSNTGQFGSINVTDLTADNLLIDKIVITPIKFDLQPNTWYMIDATNVDGKVTSGTFHFLCYGFDQTTLDPDTGERTVIPGQSPRQSIIGEFANLRRLLVLSHENGYIDSIGWNNDDNDYIHVNQQLHLEAVLIGNNQKILFPAAGDIPPEHLYLTDGGGILVARGTFDEAYIQDLTSIHLDIGTLSLSGLTVESITTNDIYVANEAAISGELFVEQDASLYGNLLVTHSAVVGETLILEGLELGVSGLISEDIFTKRIHFSTDSYNVYLGWNRVSNLSNILEFSSVNFSVKMPGKVIPLDVNNFFTQWATLSGSLYLRLPYGVTESIYWEGLEAPFFEASSELSWDRWGDLLDETFYGNVIIDGKLTVSGILADNAQIKDDLQVSGAISGYSADFVSGKFITLILDTTNTRVMNAASGLITGDLTVTGNIIGNIPASNIALLGFQSKISTNALLAAVIETQYRPTRIDIGWEDISGSVSPLHLTYDGDFDMHSIDTFTFESGSDITITGNLTNYSNVRFRDAKIYALNVTIDNDWAGVHRVTRGQDLITKGFNIIEERQE